MQIVTATTFQLKHYKPECVKCHFEVGDKVEFGLGIGIITWLDVETGNCKVKLIG